jgi:acyl-CoA dehydrogenase
VLKHFEDQGRRASDLPLVEWSVRTLMYHAQEQLHSFLRNFPNRPVAFFLRRIIFPRGRTYYSPADELGQKVVALITQTGESRERLSEQAFTTLHDNNPLGLLQEALELSEKLAPLEQKLRQARKEGLLKSEYLGYQIDEAKSAEVISATEADKLREFHDKVFALLSVDDFSPDEIGRPGTRASTTASTSSDPNATASVSTINTKKATGRKPATKKTKRKVTSKKKTTKKKTSNRKK